MFADDNLEPRHLSTGKCLCQFIEEQLITSDKITTRSSSSQTQKAKFERRHGESGAANTECRVVIDIGEPKVKPRMLTTTQQVIPTLSRMISLRDRETHGDSYDFESVSAMANLSPALNLNGVESRLANSNQWRTQPAPSSIGEDDSSESSEADLHSTTRDISLELGGDSIGRSGDLVKRLRLLLELRKDDLQGIGSSLFSDIQSRTPQFLADNSTDHTYVQNHSSTGYTTADSLTIDSSQHDPPVPRTPTPVQGAKKGKKIFRQRDGLFLLGMIGTKKSQQQEAQQPKDRILEIC